MATKEGSNSFACTSELSTISRITCARVFDWLSSEATSWLRFASVTPPVWSSLSTKAAFESESKAALKSPRCTHEAAKASRLASVSLSVAPVRLRMSRTNSS
jgi:hypothetical protein